MDLVKIDIIRLEAFEGSFTCSYDVQAAVSVLIDSRAGDKIVKPLSGAAFSEVDFCGEENLMASFIGLECAAYNALPLAFGINITGVQKIDSDIEGTVEHAYALVFGSGIGEIICAEA